jgi:hypothetical protein
MDDLIDFLWHIGGVWIGSVIVGIIAWLNSGSMAMLSALFGFGPVGFSFDILFFTIVSLFIIAAVLKVGEHYLVED